MIQNYTLTISSLVEFQSKWCASRWYWTRNCLIVVYNIIKLLQIHGFYKFLWWCLEVYNEFKDHDKKFQFKIFKVKKSMSKTSHFWASLLMMSSKDLNLIFYIWLFNTTIEVIMKVKKIQFKQHFATTFKPLTKKIMVSAYRSTILVHFTNLPPTTNWSGHQ